MKKIVKNTVYTVILITNQNNLKVISIFQQIKFIIKFIKQIVIDFAFAYTVNEY